MIRPISQHLLTTSYEFLHNNLSIGSFDVIFRNDGEKEIWCFGIQETYRNQGFGQQMLKECLDMLPNSIVELGCLKNNHRALHIYHKFGFAIVCDCGSYYWMRKEIE
jgi:ribosomal protein S18 acetylase RimI-like enzyme